MLVIQRLRMTETEGPEESGRGSVSPPAERALPCSGHCDFLRRNAALCITFLHRCLPCLTLSYRSGKNGTLNNL